MKILIVEDDSVSSLLLKTIMSSYGDCDLVADGKNAVQHVKESLVAKAPYDLICLDIMLPELDGRDALKQIRKTEETFGIVGLDCAKVIMITALGDNRTILESFRSQCEGYIVKPIRKKKVVDQLALLGIIKEAEA